jgi:hypothetical protein
MIQNTWQDDMESRNNNQDAGEKIVNAKKGKAFV